MRIDLALPSDVPLADLLPTLLRYAGDELADDPSARDGWVLSRLGGVPLDNSHTPAQLDVRDGELLYLRPRADEMPQLVFDDVVDAVATATQERAGRWGAASTRLFGLTLGVLALLAGVVVVLLAGPPQLPGGLIGLGMAVVLLATAVVLARAVGDSRAGMLVALVATAYAAVGGLLVLAGDRTVGRLAAAHVVIAASAVLVATVIAAVGVGDSAPVFFCLAVATFALLLTAGISVLFGASAPAAAAIVVTICFGMLPALPMLAYRLAGLPIPSVPRDPEQLKQDTESVDGARVLELAGRADAFLAAALGALAFIGAGGSVLMVQAGVPGVVLASVLGLLLLSRARWFRRRAQRLPLLSAGLVALAATGTVAFAGADITLRLTAVLGGTLVLAALAIGFGLAGERPKASPLWGRTLDILEIVLILGLIPLAVWVTGLYAWIRAIRG
jgi:type VII secretion integral membrane protein EccD